MGEETLVEELSSEGSILESKFRRMVPSARLAAAIARDALTGEWQVILPLPPEESRASAYKKLQHLILDLDLSLSINRIVLVKADDPGLAELQENSRVAGSRLMAPQDPVEVGGRIFLDARPLRIEPQAFEQEVNQILEPYFGDDVDFVYGRGSGMRPHYRQALNERVGARFGRGYGASHREIHDLADLSILKNESIILVEAKAHRSPLPHSSAMYSFGQLNYAQRILTEFRHVSMILVSATGFTNQVMSKFGDFEDFALVDWRGGSGESEILSVARRLLF